MFKHVDMSAGMRRLADRKIEEAMREGKFDRLGGAGKPLDLEPMPADENARLTWWAVRLLRRNDVVPDEFRLRKQIATLTRVGHASSTEDRARASFCEANELIRRLNQMGAIAVASGVVLLDVEAEVLRWRAGHL